VATTPQLEMFFRQHGSPKSRCSELLKELEEEKWVEGQQNRMMGHAKAWRLGRVGKAFYNVKRSPISFRSRRLQHQLKITDVFLSLWLTQNLRTFTCELREEFEYKNKEENGEITIAKYCPDAFFVYDNTPYFLEVQRSPLSSRRWQKKWDVAEAYFSSGERKIGQYLIQKPRILVISTQNPAIVKGDGNLPLAIYSCSKQLVRELKSEHELF
jgi:hypothetical protein